MIIFPCRAMTDTENKKYCYSVFEVTCFKRKMTVFNKYAINVRELISRGCVVMSFYVASLDQASVDKL